MKYARRFRPNIPLVLRQTRVSTRNKNVQINFYDLTEMTLTDHQFRNS